MKIYTKTGDRGETMLFGGKRVSKSHIRVAAYGSLDELSVRISFFLLAINLQRQQTILDSIQKMLFEIGSYLALAITEQELLDKEMSGLILSLENEIDLMQQELPELRSFILPRGNEAAVRAHLCRVVTRRAERVVVQLDEQESVCEAVLIFLNRLSDYFFLLARYLNWQSNEEEITWQP